MKEIGFLFDLDGVLIDSETEYSRIWNEIDRCFPSGTENLAYVIKGQTLTKILNDHYPDAETQGLVRQMLHKLEQQMVYRYCNGAEELLQDLGRRGIPKAVVTSSDDVKMAHLYSQQPTFRSLIDALIDATKVTRSKPDPQGYLLGAKELGVPVCRCVVFEDSVQGVMAGRASGAYVVGIEGTKPRRELEPYSDEVVAGFEEIDINSLLEILKSR